MGIATGVFKFLYSKRQTALGTKAPAGAGGSSKSIRRVTSSLDAKKASFQSNELLTSQQVRDMRHGVKNVAGSVSGELSVGGYQDYFESVLRQVCQTAETTTALVNVTAAAGVAPAGTFTRATGSYLTDGFQIGDVVRWTGWATTGVPNNAHNMIITALTATVMTCYPIDGVAVAAKASGDSVTCALVGKKTWVPQSAQTRDYYTIEHWFSDIAQSEQFTDVVITGCNISLPATGMATVEWTAMGLGMDTGTAQYFTSPAVPPTGGIEAAVNGVLLVGGVVAANVTGITINIAGNYTAPGGVVGKNVDPDIFPGVVVVTGSITALFQDAVLRDAFINETESSVAVALTDSNVPAAGFTAFVMSRIKYSGADKSDGNTGLSITAPFQALENVAGGNNAANLATTISVQDSAFV